MGDKGQPPGALDSVQQPLGVLCVGGHFLVRAEYQQVVFLRLAGLVVYFFTHQHQHTLVAFLESRHGRSRMVRFLEDACEDQEAAFLTLLEAQLDLDALEAQWIRWLQS